MPSAGGQELQPSEVNNSSTTGRVSAPAAATNPTGKLEANSTERKLCPMLSRPAMEGLNDILRANRILSRSRRNNFCSTNCRAIYCVWRYIRRIQEGAKRKYVA